MGDREFVGGHWMAYLAENNVYFVLRLRENQFVARDGYATWSITRIAHRLKPGQSMRLKTLKRLLAMPDRKNASIIFEHIISNRTNRKPRLTTAFNRGV